MKALIRFAVWISLFTAGMPLAQAQYFGRNKPIYENFNFQVYQSSNFEIYSYLNNPERRTELAGASEMWYRFHQNILNDTIPNRNPLIFYNDHPDFQQTNSISGQVGAGTGGVTEAFKNRVIMPINVSNQATIQVLGHELVHAFQFNAILGGDSSSLQNLGNLPLWIVEGMAEYMSIGSVDAHTAMWMRDAVVNKDVPTLDQMNNPKYFPYRYGHAFWVFLTGLKGDDIIEPFFRAIYLYGVDVAIPMVLNMKKEDLSKLWQEALQKQFQPFVDGKEKTIPGKAVLDEQDGGNMNISPSLSPNGRYILFLSEKNLFSTDIFLAEASSGKIIKTVASTSRSGDIDFFDFIESSGTWSPDSRRVAFVGFSKGRNILIIKDPLTGKTLEEGPIKDLPAFANPSWAPKGEKILLSGLVDGQTDLFLYDLRSKQLTRLTNDRYSEIHASWGEDGQQIVFSTDQLAFDKGRTYGKLTYNLAIMDMTTRAVDHIDIFPGADNLNPLFDTEGHIFFLSNRDGYRNLYRYEPQGGQVFQLTDLATGISGIAHYSPAISVDRRQNRVLYTLYNKRGYSIYRAEEKDWLNKEVDPTVVTLEAAFLPRLNRTVKSIVDAQLATISDNTIASYAATQKVPFKSKFKLDYIGGGGGLGVGTSNTIGTTTGLAGAIDMLFSDILGNNQFFVSLAMNGEIQDFGGSVAYLNRKNKLHYGASLSHIPFRNFAIEDITLDTLPCADCPKNILFEKWTFLTERVFQDRVGLFTQLPFSSTFRLEADIDFTLYSESLIRESNYYDGFGQLVYRDRDRLDAPAGFSLWSLGAAAVGDNSFFGLTSPLNGHRYRLEARQYMGEFSFFAATADLRAYRFFKPIGLAARVMHYGRYGQDGRRLYPMYLGSPWFVRGFNSDVTNDLLVQGVIEEDNLFGSSILLGNFEVRIPFTGPKQLSLIPTNFLLTDLNFFVDGGLAWFDFDQFKDQNESGFAKVNPLFSAGASLRVNLFGALVLEPFYAVPLVKNAKGGFGLNFLPGW
ncbi:MAG: PD40 domain-containing protein [Haliscomenobacter sp.]|nr:PD40 domain-containing protein [Haliscomenobacter sp.]